MKINRGVRPDSGQTQLHPLTRVEGIHVWVSHLDPRLAAEGLDSQRLWREARQHLVQAGLPVLPAVKMRTQPMYPCLGILVHADPANVLPPAYIYSVEVFFVQKITLTGAPRRQAMRMTWCREAIGDVRGQGRNFDWSPLYRAVGLLVDAFVQEVLGQDLTATPSKAIN